MMVGTAPWLGSAVHSHHLFLKAALLLYVLEKQEYTLCIFRVAPGASYCSLYRWGCLVSSERTGPNLAFDRHSWETFFSLFWACQHEENINVQEHRGKGGGSKASPWASSWGHYTRHYTCLPSANSWWGHLSFLLFFSFCYFTPYVL